MNEPRSYRIRQRIEPGSNGRIVHCVVCDSDIGIVCSERAANIVAGWHAVAHVSGIRHSA